MSFQSLGSQESSASSSARFGVETKKLWLFEDDCAHHERKCRSRTPILLLLGHIFEHFLELKLCILYFVLKLGNSGVQRFKRCAIWSWNKKVMVVWRWMCKVERKFYSWDAIWKGVSQLRNHPLAHECHFAVPYAHFAAAKWAAKIPLLYKILPSLRKRSPSFKNGMRSSFLCFIFPFGYQMDTKWSSSFKMATKMLQASKWTAKFPFGCEMFL